MATKPPTSIWEITLLFMGKSTLVHGQELDHFTRGYQFPWLSNELPWSLDMMIVDVSINKKNPNKDCWLLVWSPTMIKLRSMVSVKTQWKAMDFRMWKINIHNMFTCTRFHKCPENNDWTWWGFINERGNSIENQSSPECYPVSMLIGKW